MAILKDFFETNVKIYFSGNFTSTNFIWFAYILNMFCLKCPIFNLAISKWNFRFYTFLFMVSLIEELLFLGLILYKMEDMLNLGLYRIFSKTKINWFQGWVNFLFFLFSWGSFRFNSSNLDKTHWFRFQGEANSKIKC